jgi:hypothetical protein
VDRRRGGALAPQPNGEIKMTVNRFELKNSRGKNGLAMDNQALEDQLERLDKEYPLILHTEAGRSFSAVRRMKAEKEMNVPLNRRTGFAISVKTGKAANELTDDEWEEFYNSLGEQLKSDYPDLHKQLFPPEK